MPVGGRKLPERAVLLRSKEVLASRGRVKKSEMRHALWMTCGEGDRHRPGLVYGEQSELAQTEGIDHPF